METSTLKLERKENGVYLLTMTAGDNRFNPTFVTDFLNAMDIVEKYFLKIIRNLIERSEGPTALITVGLGKFYSNGLDLNWMAANKSKAGFNLLEVHKIFVYFIKLNYSNHISLRLDSSLSQYPPSRRSTDTRTLPE
jgi:enoyl-CoA hydratase/carnithine racemase